VLDARLAGRGQERARVVLASAGAKSAGHRDDLGCPLDEEAGQPD